MSKKRWQKWRLRHKKLQRLKKNKTNTLNMGGNNNNNNNNKNDNQCWDIPVILTTYDNNDNNNNNNETKKKKIKMEKNRLKGYNKDLWLRLIADLLYFMAYYPNAQFVNPMQMDKKTKTMSEKYYRKKYQSNLFFQTQKDENIAIIKFWEAQMAAIDPRFPIPNTISKTK